MSRIYNISLRRVFFFRTYRVCTLFSKKYVVCGIVREYCKLRCTLTNNWNSRSFATIFNHVSSRVVFEPNRQINLFTHLFPFFFFVYLSPFLFAIHFNPGRNNRSPCINSPTVAIIKFTLHYCHRRILFANTRYFIAQSDICYASNTLRVKYLASRSRISSAGRHAIRKYSFSYRSRWLPLGGKLENNVNVKHVKRNRGAICKY